MLRNAIRYLVHMQLIRYSPLFASPGYNFPRGIIKYVNPTIVSVWGWWKSFTTTFFLYNISLLYSAQLHVCSGWCGTAQNYLTLIFFICLVNLHLD